MIDLKIDFNTDQFKSLCRDHAVEKLFVFGSAANGNFTQESDIDFLAEINVNDPLERGELLLRLWNALETYFYRKVDLLTPNSLQNQYLIESINQTKKLVYDRQEEEIL